MKNTWTVTTNTNKKYSLSVINDIEAWYYGVEDDWVDSWTNVFDSNPDAVGHFIRYSRNNGATIYAQTIDGQLLTLVGADCE